MTTLMQLVTAKKLHRYINYVLLFYTHQLIREKNLLILTDELRERLLNIKIYQRYKQAVTMADVFLQDYYHLV